MTARCHTFLLVTTLLTVPVLATAQYPEHSPVARSGIAGGVTTVPADIIADGLRGTELLDATIENGGTRELGRVDDLIAARNDGQIDRVVVARGGLLGINERQLVIPVERFAALGKIMVLRDATPESLAKMPAADDATLASPSDIRVSDLIDASVYNNADEKLGEVEDVIISKEGVITVVILETGGFLGLGKHRLAIPRQQFVFKGERLLLPRATRAMLLHLPAYEGR